MYVSCSINSYPCKFESHWLASSFFWKMEDDFWWVAGFWKINFGRWKMSFWNLKDDFLEDGIWLFGSFIFRKVIFHLLKSHIPSSTNFHLPEYVFQLPNVIFQNFVSERKATGWLQIFWWTLEDGRWLFEKWKIDFKFQQGLLQKLNKQKM